MLQFLRKNLQISPKKRFLLTLFIFSMCGHSTVFFVALYVMHDTQPLLINTLRTIAPSFVFVPLQRSVPGALTQLQRAQAHATQKPAQNALLAKKAPASTQNASQIVNKNATKTTLIPPQTPEQKKAILAKTETKKPSVIKKEIAPPATKAAMPKKKLPPEKKITNTPAVPPKKSSPPPPAPLAQSKAAAESVNQQQNSTPTQSQVQNISSDGPQEPIYLGQDDLDQIRLSQEVTIGIAQHWQRPAGFSATTTCRLKVTLTSDGNKDVYIEQSSGALLYDVCAKKAIFSYAFPRALWNRELILIM